MNKQQKERFGNIYYLLGKRREDGKKVYLHDFEWSCGWYWSGGIVNGFTTNDIDGWEHIDSIASNAHKDMFSALKDYFSELVLTDDELWIFCDLLRSFYTLKEAAEIYYQGNSHFTEKVLEVVNLKDQEQYEHINQKLLGAKIIPAIRDLLEP